MKSPRNIAAQAFPDQFRRLRPEHTAAGGVKARSDTEKRRLEVYLPIRDLFLEANEACGRCRVGFAAEVHHKQGREGLLLFDVRHFLPVCPNCHRWIHDNPEQAMEAGWLDSRQVKG